MRVSMEHAGDLALEPIACPICGHAGASTLALMPDFGMGVPGRFPLARCGSCGLLYQNPRVREDQLERMYPAHYRAHARDPELGRLVGHLDDGDRWFLAARLGYAHLGPARVGASAAVRAWARGAKLATVFPPWTGAGRLLDVGCGSGHFLRRMALVGWRVAGVEFDAEAAARARTVAPLLFEGDPADADFAPGSFDVVTSFHVVEHLPRPRAALANMLSWLAPGGLMIVEVPNAGGVGAHVFGGYWSGYDYPRHLTHFTPETMTALVERAGGRVERVQHRTKPRYLIRSLENLLAGRPGALARAGRAAIRSRAGRGAAKLALEVALPLARPARMGEVARYFIRRAH